MLSFIKWAPAFSSYSLFCCTIVSHWVNLHAQHMTTYIFWHRKRGGYPFLPPEERLPLYKWTKKDDGSLLLYFFPHPPFHVRRLVSSLPSSSTAPSGLSCCCNVVVVVVYHWTSDANLCFALALCPLLVVVHILSVLPSSVSPPLPLCPLHCPRLTCNDLFHAFFNIHFDLPSPPPSPSPSPLLSLLFLTLVMSALACFGVTNHPLRNLRAKSKHPPTQKPCITIGCFLLATTYLALCLLLCVRPLACPALPWLAAASSCPLCDWLCWWRTCSSPKYGLLADRYHFCEKCFNEIQGESVSLGDDPSQPQT